MSVRDVSYREELSMRSEAWRIESNCETHYIQGGEMLIGKPEDQKSYQGELGVQLGFLYTIKIMVSIFCSTTLVVNSCDNISALRKASIHLEAVKSRWKQADLISRLSVD